MVSWNVWLPLILSQQVTEHVRDNFGLCANGDLFPVVNANQSPFFTERYSFASVFLRAQRRHLTSRALFEFVMAMFN